MATKARRDAGLEQIDAWGRWFLNAHLTMLAEKQLIPHERERETAAVRKMTAAVVERMRADYLAGRRTNG